MALRVTDARAFWEDDTGVIVARFRWYVNQPTGQSGLQLDAPLMAQWPPLVTANGVAPPNCGFFEQYQNGTAPEGTGFACQDPNCALISGAALPSYLTSKMPLTDSAWLEYSATMRCNTTSHTSEPVETRVQVPYVIRNATGVATDLTMPPYVTFSMTYSFPAVARGSLSFQLAGGAIKLNASTFGPGRTLTEVVKANEGQTAGGPFNWGDVLAFRVQLAQPEDRVFGYVKPLAAVLVARSQTPVSPAATGAVGAGDRLGSGWCDLTSADIMGVTSVLLPPLPAAVEALVMPELYAQLVAVVNGSSPLAALRPAGVGAMDFVWDSSGGLALPLTNHMPGMGGQVSLTLCAIVEVVPYAPISRGGYWPLYVTEGAARRASSGGSVQVQVGGVTYYMPSAVSLVCVPALSATSPANAQLWSSPACLQAGAGVTTSRRLLQAQVATFGATTTAVLLPPPKDPAAGAGAAVALAFIFLTLAGCTFMLRTSRL